MENIYDYTRELYKTPKNGFLYLVVVTKRERCKQGWNEGFSDAPRFEYNTYNHICENKKEVDKVYSDNKHALTITKYDCFKRTEFIEPTK